MDQVMLLAASTKDGRPLTIADLAQFIAALANAGVPASTVPLLRLAPALDDTNQQRPPVGVAAVVTDDQAVALPDSVQLTTLDGVDLEDALADTQEV